MKFVSTLAIAAVVAGSGILAASATAQTNSPIAAKNARKNAKAPAQQPGQRKYSVGKEAQKAITDLETAVKTKQTENFAQLLAAAEAVAKNADEKYLVARYRLDHAQNIKDQAAMVAAAQAVLASGVASAEETAKISEYLARVAAQTDPAAAEALYTRQLAADPANVDALADLARTKLELKKDSEALELLQRAIAVSKTKGEKAPESWYRKSLEIAHNQRNRPLSLQISREVLGLYPSPENLRNAIAVYRDGAQIDKETDIDLLRLMRGARAISAQGYYDLAQNLNDAGFPGEAKGVLDEGVGLGVVPRNAAAPLLATASARIPEDRASLATAEAKARAAANGTLALKTAEAYLGYGDYAKAADLFQAALAKGGVDSNLVNTRLGIALAMAGRKAEAEASFKAVTGPRADLAALWLSWLRQRG
jgi:tetratricopeptide (TPR) repeat protein